MSVHINHRKERHYCCINIYNVRKLNLKCWNNALSVAKIFVYSDKNIGYRKGLSRLLISEFVILNMMAGNKIKIKN
jgi:hypothetical protein